MSIASTHRFMLSALLTLVVLPGSALADQWIYREILNPESMIRIESDPDAITVDGQFGAAQYCAKDAEYVCIVASGFQFYFPRHKEKSVTSWSINGTEYTASSEYSLPYFGRRYEDVFVVKSDVPGGAFMYVYSVSGGLLALGGQGSSTSSLYVLESECGFGAADRCSQQARQAD